VAGTYFPALHVHLAFTTRYRRGVLTADMTGYLAGVPAKACQDFGAVLAECNGEDDHVHLLAEYPPKVPVSTLVNPLKGVSARRLRQQYQVRTHHDLWSPPYLAASSSGTPLNTIRAYIEPAHARLSQAAIPSLNAGACAAQNSSQLFAATANPAPGPGLSARPAGARGRPGRPGPAGTWAAGPGQALASDE
jgi:putative transposase